MAGDIYTDAPTKVKIGSGVAFSGSFRPYTEVPDPPDPPTPDPGLEEDVHAIRESLEELVGLMREVYNR
jgi:hypothetical protein